MGFPYPEGKLPKIFLCNWEHTGKQTIQKLKFRPKVVNKETHQQIDPLPTRRFGPIETYSTSVSQKTDNLFRNA